MVIKKPYAFFIKMFKPFHIVLTLLLAYLIYLENSMLSFYTQYIFSDVSNVSQTISSLYNNGLYIIPIIFIVSFLLIFGIMFQKKKPYLFYLIYILAFIVVVVVNSYSIDFLHNMEKHVVTIKSVKLIHDFTLIAVIIEISCFLVTFVRGLGINIKQFDFNSDLSKIDISDKDREEFEINININLDATRKKRREKLRKLKYFYFENKFIANIIIGSVLAVVLFLIGIGVYNVLNYKREGKEYFIDNYNIIVNDTLVTNINSKGKKVTENNLIVVDLQLKSDIGKKLYLKDFTLNIEGIKFKPTEDYYNSFVDIAPAYLEESLSYMYENYIIVYEIPEKYIDGRMSLNYISEGKSINIRLNPQKSEPKTKIISTKKIPEEISLEGNFGNVKFNIDEMSISDEFVIDYDYCFSENDCVKSKEHLRPSMDTNFDKKILRLKINYKSENNEQLTDFYKFILMFGSINYKIGEIWYSQNGLFEQIKSNKKSDGYMYIGVNNLIADSTSAKFVFNVRGEKYEYVLW